MNKNLSDFNIADEEDRVDGVAKVTGKATFTAEHKITDLAFAVLVSSTIARGYIKRMHLFEAKNAPGVVDIIYYMNCPVIPGYKPVDKVKNPNANDWQGHRVFYNNLIAWNGQPVAMVIADTYERALYAASLVKVEYGKENADTDFESLRLVENKLLPAANYLRGEADAYKKADVKLEAEFIIPIETHNPIEMHSTIAVWEANDKLTVYDKSQSPKDTRIELARLFDLPEKNVRVVTEYVGGAFGSAIRRWPHVQAAVAAAKKINRPVKLMLNRDQMFTTVGYRPFSWQSVGIGATRDGKLTGITHHAISNTSQYENFREGISSVSQYVYACENVNTSYKLLPLDLPTPTWMRGPGPASGCFALESMMDDLAYELNIDPIELRLRNYALVHPHSKLPWTSKYLKECYELGKEKIGWKNRPSTPASLREDGMLVGYGMATGIFGADRGEAAAKGILKNDGTLVLQSAVSDMGPGTATAMVKIASDWMEMPPNKIRFEMGDTDLPPGPLQAGSGSTSGVGTAITEVCKALQMTLKELAVTDISSLKIYKLEDLQYEKGTIFPASDQSLAISVTDILTASGKEFIEVSKQSTRATAERDNYAMNSFSAHFIKLQVHPNTGVIKLKHIVSVADCGKVISEKTARSQMVGGAVGGVGMALHEETLIDARYGKFINTNLADYHVPVHADIPVTDVLFVNKPDPIINPMGSKGVGEIALVGVAPAVANAVYNATGKRIRRLPITPDKLI